MTVVVTLDPKSATRSVVEWVSDWSPEQPVPAELAPILPAVIERVERALNPAGRDALEAQIRGLVAYATAFNIPLNSRQIAGVSAAYAETLWGLPYDLLSKAFARTRSLHRWGNRMPLPAEILDTVRDEWSRRKLVRLRLMTAASKMPAAHDPLREDRSPENAAAVAQLLAEHRARFRSERSDNESAGG